MGNVGVAGAMNLQLNYLEFESAFFRFCREVDVPALFSDKTDLSAGLKARLVEVEEQLGQDRDKFKTARNKAAFLEPIDQIETERLALVEEREKLATNELSA